MKDQAKSNHESRPRGIAFNRVEVSFIYSFFCSVSDFEQLAKKVKLGKFSNSLHTADQKDCAAQVENSDEGKFVWRTVPHPERRGLTPNFDFVHRSSGIENGACDEICCHFHDTSMYEISSGYSDEDFATEPSKFDIRIIVDSISVIIRFGRNGMGTVNFSIKFDTSKTKIDKHFPGAWKKRQKRLFDQIGAIPFIFGVLTLARAEHVSLNDGPVPLSKLRRIDGPLEGILKEEFVTLHEHFQAIFDHVIRPEFFFLSNEGQAEPKPTTFGKSGIHFLDTALLGTGEVADEAFQYWQSPTVTVCGSVDKKDTYLKDPGTIAAAQAWWFYPYEGLFEDDKTDQLTLSGSELRVWQCYKEVTILLLRLYQWRDILSVNELLSSTNEKAKNLEPHWRRILVLPELLSESHYGRVFNDVDLVWDPRFLMLYHERCTLVLNTDDAEDGLTTRGSFRRLFQQSLMRTLEGIRGQLHAGIVLNLYLDTLIEKISESPEKTRDMNLLRELQMVRSAFAKILRDPNAMATDAAALAQVRRRAHKTYEISAHYRQLRSKFDAISQLFGGQATISNMTAIEKVLQTES